MTGSEDFVRGLAREPWAVSAGLHARAMEAARRGASTFLLPELAPLVARLGRELCGLSADASGASPGEVEETRELEALGHELVARGTPYHGLLRHTVRWLEAVERRVRARHPGLPDVFVPKCREELEPLLQLWPEVIVFPAFAELSERYFRRTRPVPVHVLGLITAPRFADGLWCSPAEFFFHDVDHVRFLVREELLARGIETPDPYRSAEAYAPASTFDARLGRHRTVLDVAVDKVLGGGLSRPSQVEARCRLARRVDGRLEALRASDPLLGKAAAMLLFEITHEKGFPLEARVLREQLAREAHCVKLGAKFAAGFYGPGAVPPGTAARLDEARAWLARWATVS